VNIGSGDVGVDSAVDGLGVQRKWHLGERRLWLLFKLLKDAAKRIYLHSNSLPLLAPGPQRLKKNIAFTQALIPAVKLALTSIYLVHAPMPLRCRRTRH